MALGGQNDAVTSSQSIVDFAEFIHYNAALDTNERNEVGGYLAWKYGLGSAYTAYTPPAFGIDNTAVSSLSNTSATFNATLYGTQSVFDVYVYWGESDGGAAPGAWANTNFVGSYTNAASTNLSFSTDSLVQDTEYYYAFVAQNDATTIWAAPSTTFTTDTVIANSPATDLTATSAVFNAVYNVTAAGTNAVQVLWGLSDGGVAEGTWDNTNDVGVYLDAGTTNISFAVTGLTDSTAYYYTFRAFEAPYGLYVAWAAPSEIFYTHGLPAVQNLGATTGIGSATLNGELLSAGGAPTTVQVYWGAMDGGTNQNAWANTNFVGSPAELVPFSTSTTSNLLYGQQYYYLSLIHI